MARSNRSDRHTSTHEARPAKTPRRTSSTSRQGPSRFFVIFAVVTIALMVFFSIVVVLPDIFGSPSDDDSGFAFTPETQVTPGAQEADMRARLEKDPNDVNAMLILADLLSNTGRSAEAIPLYEKAVDLKPDDITLRIAFGRTLMQSGYDLDAQLQLEKAKSIDPSDPEPLYLLGQLYQNQKPPQTDKAKQMYEEVSKVAPNSPYADQAKDQLSKLNGGS